MPHHLSAAETATRTLGAMKSILLSLLAGSLIGCPKEQAASSAAPLSQPSTSPDGSPHPNAMEPSKQNSHPRRLIISKTTSAGRPLQIGTLNFDETNHATLATEGEGPAVEELKTAWAEISKAGELIWKQSRPGEVDGQKVTRLVGEKAKPGDDIYIYAVLDNLERKYGFSVDIGK
jgi:hypothetical protein